MASSSSPSIPSLFAIPPDDAEHPIDLMAPTTRSSPNSPSIPRLSSTASKARRKTAAELAYADAITRERTKRGCWTCRIRRKKCDEDPIEGVCRTCRRLCLECLGWGSKRPEWMKDKKAVDAKKAEIKLQLATQGMIRGQAKNQNPAIPNQHRERHLPSSSTSASFLAIPPTSARHRSLSSSDENTTPSPSSISIGIPRTRHERAAKTSANAALYNTSQDSASSRGISPNSEDDGSGSDDDEYDLSSPQDSEMSPLPADDGNLELPRLFNSSAVNNGPSSCATPSYPDSPLPSGGAFPDHDANGSFPTNFPIHNLGDRVTIDSIMAESALEALGNASMMDLSGHGLEDSYGDLNVPLMNDYDLYAALSGGGAKSYEPMSVSLPKPAFSDLSARPTSISPPALTGHSTTRRSNNASPLLQPPTIVNGHNGQRRSPSAGAAFSMAASASPGGFTTPSGQLNLGPDSYFPARPLTSSPPPLVQAPPSATGGSMGVPALARQPFGPQVPPATAAQQLALIAQAPKPQAYGTFTISYKPTIRSPLTDPARGLSGIKETLVYAYFNKGVRRMQYLLADDSTTGVTDVMYDLVIKDPSGPVTNAICSLSSLHDTRLRIAHGLVHPEDPNAHDQAQKLYMDTVVQLSQKSGKFSAVEAIASLHLLSFWLFCGGGGEWHSALGMAADWLQTSDVMNKRADPVEVLERWPPTHRFAAQATLWFDILGSCSLRRAPRFMKLYRRMAERNQRISDSTHGGGRLPSVLFNQRKPSGSELMNQVMGCDDDVMFALAHIAELAAWKDEQEKAGTLSYRELVRRADAIEMKLSATKVVMSPVSSSSHSHSRSSTGLGSPPTAQAPNPAMTARPPPVWDPYNMSAGIPSATTIDPRNRAPSFNAPSPPRLSKATGTATSSSSTSSSATGAPGPLSIITTEEPVTLRQLSSNVFREAAFLFLRSVVSGCNPAVAEIQESVQSLMQSLQSIPSNDLDRSLAFPITLGGCLAGTHEQVLFFTDRLAAQGSAVGNGSQAKLLVETVWQRRENGEKNVCWRDAMVRNLKFDLLLV